MENLVAKGLVKSIGVSNFNVQLLWDMLSYASILPVCNEVELHPLNTQEKLVTFLHQNKILPIGYCPLAKGQNLLEHPLVLSLCEKYKCSGS